MLYKICYRKFTQLIIIFWNLDATITGFTMVVRTHGVAWAAEFDAKGFEHDTGKKTLAAFRRFHWR